MCMISDTSLVFLIQQTSAKLSRQTKSLAHCSVVTNQGRWKLTTRSKLRTETFLIYMCWILMHGIIQVKLTRVNRAVSFALATGSLPQPCQACCCRLSRSFPDLIFAWHFSLPGGCPPLSKTDSPSFSRLWSIWNNHLIATLGIRDSLVFLRYSL